MKMKDFNMAPIDVDPYTSDLLKGCFGLQDDILKGYKELEKIPPWPIDPTEEKHLAVLRDIISRCIEELAEGYSEYVSMVNMMSLNTPPKDFEEPLYNFNEEMADAFHYLVELCILSGISSEDIFSFYTQLLEELNLKDALLGEKTLGLNTCFDYSNHVITWEQGLLETLKYPSYNILRNIPNLDRDCLMGGRKVLPDFVPIYKQLLWDITYNGQMARNLLKGKKWSLSKKETNFEKFQIQLMEMWLSMFVFFKYVGLTPISLYTIYHRKNLINRERLRENGIKI